MRTGLHLHRPGFRPAQAPSLVLLTPPRGPVISLEGQTELLAALAERRTAYRRGLALEMAGDAGRVRFFARAATPAGAALLDTLLTTYYPQGVLGPVAPADDPARRRPGEAASARELRLRRRSEVPLRPPARPRAGSSADGETARELLRVLGALGRTDPGVRALCQLMLWPIGPAWGEALARDLERARREERGDTSGRGADTGPPLLPLLVLLGLALLGDAAYTDFHAHRLGDLGHLGATLAGTGSLMWFGHYLFAPEALPAADLLARKLAAPPFGARLRLVAFGGSAEARAATLDRLVAAYAGYGGPRDNAFVARPCTPDALARLTLSGGPPLWRRPLPVLNAEEVARLWRPLGEEDDLPGLPRAGAHGLLPADDRLTQGLAIGHARAAGKTVPVLLPRHALRSNMAVIGATGQGKSVFFRHYVTRAIAEEGVQVILLDPETDLFRDVLGALPERERLRAVALDFNHPTRVPGFNLVDARGVGSGPQDDRTVDQVISSITLAWERFYSEAWGNRLQDLVEFATETLLRANMARLRASLPQYTFLDIKPLLTHGPFRLQVLREAGDIKLDAYWRDDYLGLPPDERAKAIKPVQTRVDTLLRNETAHAIIGQRASTFSIPELVRSGQHLFLNTAAYAIGRSTAAMLDAILLNIINDVVCARPAPRRPVLIVVDEFQHAPARWDEYFTLVRKRAGAYAVAAQGVALIERVERGLATIVLDNTQTQVVFHSRDYEEAAHRAALLEQVVTPADIQRLAVRQCYLKTGDERGPLAVVQAEIPPPPVTHESTARLVVEACAQRYGVERAAVLAEQRAWMTRLYHAASRTSGAGAHRRTRARPQKVKPRRASSRAPAPGAMLPGSQPSLGVPVTRLRSHDAHDGGIAPSGGRVVSLHPKPPAPPSIGVAQALSSPHDLPPVRTTAPGQPRKTGDRLSRREKAERRAREAAAQHVLEARPVPGAGEASEHDPDHPAASTSSASAPLVFVVSDAEQGANGDEDT